MEKTKKMKKPLKITIIVVSVILVLLIIVALVLPKTIAMSVYNEYFGVRYTSYEPTTWELSDFEGLSAEKHRFYSDKGQVITAYLYSRERTKTKGIIVMAHGFGGGGHRNYMDVIDYFAKNGYLVFAYDATGNDESEGDAVGGLPQGVIDLEYALDYIDNFSGYPILLWGHSWGGYSVCSVPAVYPEVKGIISVSGFNQSLDMLESEGRNIAGDAIDFVLPYLKKHEEKTFNEYAYMSGLQSLTLTDAPVMVIHSADDEVVPIEISYDRYYEKFKDNERFTFIRCEDKGHNLILCSDEALAYREEYNKKGDEWLESIGGSENLTPEMRAEYIETNFDMHKGDELDSELMEEMLKFYDECVKK